MTRDSRSIVKGPFKRIRIREALYRSDEPFQNLFVVRRGFFKTVATIDDGREQITGFSIPGEMLGIDSVGAGTHATSAFALTDAVVSVIGLELLDDPAFNRELHKLMSRELARNQGIMMLLGTMSAEQRVAAFLLDISLRFKACGMKPHELELPMTRAEIGSYLSVALESVSRALSRFQKEGVIAVRGRRIIILDAVKLREQVDENEAWDANSTDSRTKTSSNAARIIRLIRG